MNKQLFLFLAFCCMLFSTTTSCNKEKEKPKAVENCDRCDCPALIDSSENLVGLTDSALAITTIKGKWLLICSRFQFKTAPAYNADWHSSDKIYIQFTDSNYTYYKNDTLQWTYPYYTDRWGGLNSHGHVFCFGQLMSYPVRYKDSLMGINTIVPSNGAYYLLFKKQ